MANKPGLIFQFKASGLGSLVKQMYFQDQQYIHSVDKLVTFLQ